MTTTTNLGITLLEQAQAQKEVTINEAFTAFDALINGTVADKDLTAPPASPVTGVAYLVAPSATGAWAGKSTSIAYFNQVLRFVTPQTGAHIWVADEGAFYAFNGTAWVIQPVGGDMLKSTYDPANVAQQMVGIAATQTITNKTISGASNTLTMRAASDITGTLPVSNGGTGQTAFTDGQLLIGNTATGSLSKATLTAGSNVTITNGNGAITIAASGGGGGFAPMVCEGRLTLTSGVPVTTVDVTAATTVYFTPYRGNRIALYDGTATWTTLSFSALSISVPSVANQMYDVFAYNNAGAATLELTAWSNDTTRATALTLQDGVYVRSGATTRRYLGSLRTLAAGQTEDSLANRYLWNYYNRAVRPMLRLEPTSSWTYSVATTRQANGSTANQLNFILGVSEDALSASVLGRVSNSTATARTCAVFVSLDSTTNVTAPYYFSFATNAGYTPVSQGNVFYAGAGRHFISWNEQGAGADMQTWIGGNASGITGQLLG